MRLAHVKAVAHDIAHHARSTFCPKRGCEGHVVQTLLLCRGMMRVSQILLAFALLGIARPVRIDAQSLARPSEPSRFRGAVDLSIGEANESRDAYIFGVIGGLAMDAQGRIIVADSKDHTIRIFAASGRYLYTIGRKGRGPGDLDGPCCLTIAENGLLWVKENGNHRYSAFRLGATKASFVRSISGATNSVWSGDRVDFDAKGRLVDLESAFNAETKTFRIVHRHIDSTGRVVERDTIPKPPADSLSAVTFATRSGMATYFQPYGATELHAFGGTGDMAHAVSSRYAVAWVAADGRNRSLLQRATVRAVALSAKERQTTDELLNSIARNTGVPRAQLALRIPDRKMPLQSLGFDLEGRRGLNDRWLTDSLAKPTSTTETDSGVPSCNGRLT